MNDTEFIWRAMCRTHYFDEQCHAAIESGRVKCFTYLSSGQEAVAATIACVFREQKINLLCQHRNHAAYLSFGGDATKLRDELLGLETGTTGGVGGDPCHHFGNERVWMVGHSGLVADQVPIAVGMALASGVRTVSFFGDSAPEEDCFWPAVGFAATHNLPIVFIEEDNGLSVITKTATRRSWNTVAVARGYGVDTTHINDDPFTLAFDLKTMLHAHGPKYIRVKTERKYRHVGAGTDGPLKNDRMQLSRIAFARQLGLPATNAIELEAKEEMSKLWSER